MSSPEADKALKAMLDRLAPINRRISASGTETATALDAAVQKVHAWLNTLRSTTGDRKHTKEAHSKLTSYLNFGAYAWEVDPALFPAEGGDQVTLSSLHPRDDEKDTVLAILDVTEGLLGYLVARCMEGRPLVEGEEVEQLEEVGWKSPLEGWQGVLLALLNGLMLHLSHWNSAQPDGPLANSTYRECFAEKLLPSLVKVAFATPAGIPNAPGKPINDDEKDRRICIELKYAALDVVGETQARSKKIRQLLRDALPLDWLGAILQSGYDSHMSAIALDLAWRMVPRRVSRKNENAAAVDHQRDTGLKNLFSVARFGQEAKTYRQAYDSIELAEWPEQSAELLETIGGASIERGQCFVIKDANFHDTHLLPTQTDEPLRTHEMLEPAKVVKDDIFSRTRIWFDRDCISFLSDEPMDLRRVRLRTAEAVISDRPEVDEEMSRDARFLVPFGSIETFEVRPLTEAKGHYTFSLNLKDTIAVDGRPFPAQALPAGPAAQKSDSVQHAHQLNFVAVCNDSDLQLLRSVIENRSQRYPELGAALRIISEADEEEQLAENRPGEQAPVEPNAAIQHGVKQAPRKSSQATPVETINRLKETAEAIQHDPRDGQRDGASEARGRDEAEPDLGKRRSELATMARLDSPTGSSVTHQGRSGGQDDLADAFHEAATDEEARLIARQPNDARQTAGESTLDESEPGEVDRRSESVDEGGHAAVDLKSGVQAKAKAKARKVVRQSPNPEEAAEHASDKEAAPPLESANAKKPANHPKSNVEHRSPRLSPIEQVEEEYQGRQGRRKVGQPSVGGKMASFKKPPATGKKTATTAHKKVVEAPRGRKRDSSDLSDDTAFESGDEPGSTSSAGDLVRGKERKAKEQEQGDSRKSKRRKKGSPDVEEADLTDYDNEFASLPEKRGRPPAKKQFGKAHNATRPITGKTRKANAKSAATSRSEKPGSRAGPPTKPKSKGDDNAPDQPEKKGVSTITEATHTRTTRSRAKKQVVVETAVEAREQSSEDGESVGALKKGDKRIAEDIPPPLDLTSSERARAQQLAPRSPSKDSPSKAKPVRTLAQLTGDASMEGSDEKNVAEAEGAVHRDTEEPEEYWEMPFEFQDDVIAEDAAKRLEDLPQTGLAPSNTNRAATASAPRAIEQTVDADSPPPGTAATGALKIEADAQHRYEDRDRAVKGGVVEDRDTSTEGKKTPSTQTVTAPPARTAISVPRSTTPPDSPQGPGEMGKLLVPLQRGSRPPAAPVDDSGVDFAANASAVSTDKSARLPRLSVDSTKGTAPPLVAAHGPGAGWRATQATFAPLQPSSLKTAQTAQDIDDMDLEETPSVIAGFETSRLQKPTGTHLSGVKGRPSGPSQSTPAHQRHPVPSGRAYEVPWSEVHGLTKSTLPVQAIDARQAAAAPSTTSRARLTGRPTQPAAAVRRPEPREVTKRNVHRDRPFYTYETRPAVGVIRPQLDLRPPDAYEEFFDGLVSLSRALVNKQREQHEQLVQRRSAAMHKVDKLVEHHMRTSACVTHEVTLAVSQQSRALLDSKTTRAVRDCAYDVRQHIASVQSDLRSLAKTLGAQPA